MMNIICKLLVCLLVIGGVNHAVANESTSRSTYFNRIQDLQSEINRLENEITTLDSYIAEVVNCGDKTPPEHYDGTSCVVLDENDPLVKSHGIKSLTAGSCSDSDKVQVFNGTSWTCKTIN